MIAARKGNWGMFIGFVIEIGRFGGVKVIFNDYKETFFTKDKVIILPQTLSPHDGEYRTKTYFISFIFVFVKLLGMPILLLW